MQDSFRVFNSKYRFLLQLFCMETALIYVYICIYIYVKYRSDILRMDTSDGQCLSPDLSVNGCKMRHTKLLRVLTRQGVGKLTQEAKIHNPSKFNDFDASIL